MAQFRKKPVVIHAARWLGDHNELAQVFGHSFPSSDSEQDKLLIKTLEGTMLASPGDYIIRGVKGEFYRCKADIFHATYEPVE